MTDGPFRPTPDSQVVLEHDQSAGQYLGDVLDFLGRPGVITIGEAKHVTIGKTLFWTIELTKKTRNIESDEEEAITIELDSLLFERALGWFSEGVMIGRTDEHFQNERLGFMAILDALGHLTPQTSFAIPPKSHQN